MSRVIKFICDGCGAESCRPMPWSRILPPNAVVQDACSKACADRLLEQEEHDAKGRARGIFYGG